MKLSSRLMLTAAIAVILCSGFGMVYKTAAQNRGAAPASAPTGTRKAGEFFKNVATSTLKELSVDDFIGAMGVMAAGLGYDCADCHRNAGYDTVNWADDSMPTKVTARKMIQMVDA